jgi:hypothetical protein
VTAWKFTDRGQAAEGCCLVKNQQFEFGLNCDMKLKQEVLVKLMVASMYHCPELETFIHSNRSRYRLYKPLDID